MLPPSVCLCANRLTLQWLRRRKDVERNLVETTNSLDPNFSGASILSAPVTDMTVYKPATFGICFQENHEKIFRKNVSTNINSTEL